jgi:predicted GTPase
MCRATARGWSGDARRYGWATCGRAGDSTAIGFAPFTSGLQVETGRAKSVMKFEWPVSSLWPGSQSASSSAHVPLSPEMNNNSAATLANEALSLLQAFPSLKTRREQLTKLRDQGDEGTLVVCVVGITSSGKSTFLNGLMGEELLPEQSRATTNLMVRCRRGLERRLDVRYADGRTTSFRGADVSRASFARLCSEDGNPGNRAGIAVLEWTSPSAVLPDKLVICDTPGLDAYGHEHHTDLTLRQYLPLADIVVYVTSIRKTFNAADLELVGAILEQDQRVLFVLSQKDVEVDSYDGGLLLKSKEEKLERHVEGLQENIRKTSGLTEQSYGIVLVSSLRAKEAAGDVSSEAWRVSGFDGVVKHLDALASQLGHVVAESRARRLLAVLQHTAHDLETSLAEVAVGKQATIVGGEDTVGLANAQRAVRQAIAATESTWRRRLAAETRTRDAAERVRGAGGSGLGEVQSRLGAEWSSMLSTLGTDLDRTRSTCLEAIRSVGVTAVRRASRDLATAGSAFPDVNRHVRHEWKEVQVRGWGESIAFWPKSERQLFSHFDHDGYIRDICAFIVRTCQLGASHLDWWLEWMRGTVEAPLATRVSEASSALAERQRLREQAQADRDRARAAHVRLLQLVKAAEIIAKRRPPASAKVGAFSSDAAPIESRGLQPAAAALVPLLARFRELEFQDEVALFLERFGEHTERVLLLGARREPSLAFIAAFLHDLGLSESLGRLDPRQGIWVASAPRSPTELATNWHSVRTEGVSHPRFAFFVAPPDDLLPKTIAWWRALDEFDAIGIAVDAPRIASGLSDLQRAPYREAISQRLAKVFLLSADGAAFRDKIADLQGDIASKTREMLKHACPWFVFEDYDARYTAFLRLLDKRSPTAQAFEREWRAAELSFREPFTEAELRQAFERLSLAGKKRYAQKD